MKTVIIALFCLSLAAPIFSQTAEETKIVAEGRKLYRSERASWVGTDVFLERFAERQGQAGGYFSYPLGERTVCVFFTKGDAPRVLVSFSFDGTYDSATAAIDDREREMTAEEKGLWTIRQKVIRELQTGDFYEYYKDMEPNPIPVIDGDGRRVYVLTATSREGKVVFGNDYLFTFDDKNEVKDRKKLHRNVILIDYIDESAAAVAGTMHTHLPETGDLITATDICTLLLYAKYAHWPKHFVIGKTKVSIWDCEKEELTVVDRSEWEKESSK